jgi:hypothetical protein
MGIMLKTKDYLRIFASLESDIKKSKMPCMMNEAFDSPGCTLHVRKIAFFYP